eukprot:SM000037S13467  [mRNA]  locus=s37:2527:6159:+ [translate_table: standard]
MQQLNAGSLAADVLLQRCQPRLHGGCGCLLPLQLLLQPLHLAVLCPQCCLELLKLCNYGKALRLVGCCSFGAAIAGAALQQLRLDAGNEVATRNHDALHDLNALLQLHLLRLRRCQALLQRVDVRLQCGDAHECRSAVAVSQQLQLLLQLVDSSVECLPAGQQLHMLRGIHFVELRLAVSNTQLQALLGCPSSNLKTCCKRPADGGRAALLRCEDGFSYVQLGLQLSNNLGTPAPAPTPATPPPGLTVLKPPCSSHPPRPGGAAPPAGDAEMAATSQSLSHSLVKQALGCRHAMRDGRRWREQAQNDGQCAVMQEPRTHVYLQLLLPLGSDVLPAPRLYLSTAQSRRCLLCLLLEDVTLACCCGGRRVELLQNVLTARQGAAHLLGVLSSALKDGVFLLKLLRQSHQRGLRDIELLAASALCSLQGGLQACNGCSAALELLHGRLHELVSGQLQRSLSAIARVPLRRRQCHLQVRHEYLARAQIRLQVHDKGLACHELGCQPSISVVQRRDLALQLQLPTGRLVELHGLCAKSALLLGAIVLLALDLSLHGLQARRHLLRLSLKSIHPASRCHGGPTHLDEFMFTVDQRAARPLSLCHKLVEHHVLLLQPVCQCRRRGLGVVELPVMSPPRSLQSRLQVCCRGGGSAGMVCCGRKQQRLGVAHGLLRSRQLRFACTELGCGGCHRGLGVATSHLLGCLKRYPCLVALLQPLQRCRHLGGSCFLASLEVAACGAAGHFQSLAKIRRLLLAGVELCRALLQHAGAAGELPLGVDGVLSGANGRAELCRHGLAGGKPGLGLCYRPLEGLTIQRRYLCRLPQLHDLLGLDEC